jgi:hypothetical protein
MSKDVVLQRVGAVHAGLLSALVVARFGLGYPVEGALLGGGLAGFSFLTFWVFARSVTEPRKKGLAILLGVLKVSFYLALTAAILCGRLVTDGSGFAFGVSCFVVATVIGALAGPIGGGAVPVTGD